MGQIRALARILDGIRYRASLPLGVVVQVESCGHPLIIARPLIAVCAERRRIGHRERSRGGCDHRVVRQQL